MGGWVGVVRCVWWVCWNLLCSHPSATLRPAAASTLPNAARPTNPAHSGVPPPSPLTHPHLHPPAAPARTGLLVESGFQSTLAALLVRIAADHPHHTLYQVGLALLHLGQRCSIMPCLFKYSFREP